MLIIMCSLHVILYVLIISTGLMCEVNNDLIYKTSIENSVMTKVIREDMHAAFNSVTHNINATENVLSNMYNMDVNAIMVFKLPSVEPNKDIRQAEKIVFMDRQQFVEPNFPNLTNSYMTLRRFKLTKFPPTHNITELMKQEMDKLSQEQTVEDSWSYLGLSGWNGDIAEPSKSQNYPSNFLGDYPHLEITKQLIGGMASEEYLKNIAANELRIKNERLEMMKDLNKNVFIARANDPFGYSTKWQMRKSNETKHKRDVFRLYSMIKCSTGCDPLIYKGYGCYCGFLGHGTPTDGIDRCCKVHDKCYEQSSCISYLEYFVPYIWKCYHGKPLCAIDHGEWGGPGSCAARLCYCDLRLSRCLRQFACPRKRAVCRSSISRRLQNILLV